MYDIGEDNRYMTFQLPLRSLTHETSNSLAKKLEVQRFIKKQTSLHKRVNCLANSFRCRLKP